MHCQACPEREALCGARRHDADLNARRTDLAGPPEGFRRLDVVTVGIGPYAAQTPRDPGADVIKAESLEEGMTRNNVPGCGSRMASLFLQLDRSRPHLILSLVS